MMAKVDTLKTIGTTVCNEYLGFVPTSDSTKPPHIANGLFRECSGETCDVKDVHKWIISERRKGVISSEDIIEEYQDILLYGNNESTSNVKEMRFLLDELFNQDKTAYPNYDSSVYNISSHWLIKGPVLAEGKLGKFLFQILAKKIDGKRSPAIELIQNALKADTDDFTKIIKPIIAFPSEQEKRNVNEVSYPMDYEIKWDACKESIRRGFDNLSFNIQVTNEHKNSLMVLERMINYAGFAAFLYLADANSALYDGQPAPIFLDAGAEIESIKKASEQTYTIAKKAVEDYYINSIHDMLQQEMTRKTKATCKKWIDGMAFSSDEREKTIKPAIISYFNSFCDDREDPVYALAHALQIAVYTFEYKNNSPSDFCRVLGVRCGLVGPRGNRAKVKRYLINSFMLETLTMSILSQEDLENGIELKELGEKAISAYNIMLGTDAETEYKLLEKYNVAQNTPGDLRGDMALNANYLADTYISLGLARRYADGVTLVGWRL